MNLIEDKIKILQTIFHGEQHLSANDKFPLTRKTNSMPCTTSHKHIRQNRKKTQMNGIVVAERKGKERSNVVLQ